MLEGRYDRNIKTLTEEENSLLRTKRVCVVGCGGLGGHVLEMLARLGVGHLTAVDSDVFDATNLNRQIFATEDVLGLSKTAVALQRLKHVNSDVQVTAKKVRLSEENAEEVLSGHDVLVDALDNVSSRLVLENAAEKLDLPFVHGAIAGWYGQVTTVFPGDRVLQGLYGDSEDRGVEVELGNPSFTPALVAALQVGEVVKILIGRGELLRRRIFYLDTLEQSFQFL